MTAPAATGDTRAPRQAMRLLRTAIGRGGSLEINGYTYAVVRARVRSSLDETPQPQDVLVRADPSGKYVALESPGRAGRRVRSMRIKPVTGRDRTMETVTVDQDAVAETMALSTEIANTILTPLVGRATEFQAALATFCNDGRSFLDGRKTTDALSSASAQIMAAQQALGDPQSMSLDDLVSHVTTVRTGTLPVLAGSVDRETRRLAYALMWATAEHPELAEQLASVGYRFDVRDVEYATSNYVGSTVPVPTIVSAAGPVHNPPARAPGDTSTHRASADTLATAEAKLGFLTDVRRFMSQITPLRGRSPGNWSPDTDATVALLKVALGRGGSVAVNDVVYDNRAVVTPDGHDVTVLFATGPRDPRIPAGIRVDTAAEWPRHDGQPAKWVSSDVAADSQQAAAYGVFYQEVGDGSRAVLDEFPSDAARARVVANADLIARAALTRETERYAEMRDLLVDSGSASAARAAAAIDQTLVSVTEDTPLETVVDAVMKMRTDAVSAAEQAIQVEAPTVAAAMCNTLAMASRASATYKEGAARGYAVLGFEVPYETRDGIRWRTMTLLSRNEVPLQQPPEQLPDGTRSVRKGNWPEMDKATALQLIRDASDLAAIARQAKAPRQGIS